jgi:putative phosphoesterase
VRIGVVSDTHLPQYGSALPRALVDGLRSANVERIVHCGDHTSVEVAALFERIAPFEAVAGNNDGPDLVARFGRRKILEFDGVRLGLTHGDLGMPSHATPQRAAETFAADAVDAVLFGHSHAPLVGRLRDGRWLVNPGSPTAKRRQPRFTWALLEIGPDGVLATPEIRAFDDRSV